MRTVKLKRRRAIMIVALFMGIVITYFAWKDETYNETKDEISQHIAVQDDATQDDAAQNAD